MSLLGIITVLTFLRQLHEMANTLNELCIKFKAILAYLQTLLSRIYSRKETIELSFHGCSFMLEVGTSVYISLFVDRMFSF